MNFPPIDLTAHFPPIPNADPSPKGNVSSVVSTSAVVVKQYSSLQSIWIIIHPPSKLCMGGSVPKINSMHTKATFLSKLSDSTLFN